MVPFLEWFNKKGEQSRVFPVRLHRSGSDFHRERSCDSLEARIKVGIQLCYDLNFEDISRRMVLNGANIFLVPSREPRFWGKWMHLQTASLTPVRAVESRRWIIRASSSGESQIVDPYGRILKRLEAGAQGTMGGKAGSMKTATFYHKQGWRLPYLCLIVFPVPVIRKLVRTIRQRRKRTV